MKIQGRNIFFMVYINCYFNNWSTLPTHRPGRPVVIIIFAHISVRTDVPTFQNITKQNKRWVKIIITTSGTVGLAERIIDDTCLVFPAIFFKSLHRKLYWKAEWSTLMYFNDPPILENKIFFTPTGDAKAQKRVLKRYRVKREVN